MKQEFLKAKADTIRLTVYQDNRPLIPTSGTIKIFSPTGGELQAETAVTVNASTGEMTFALTAEHTADNKPNHKAEWSYVVSGTTFFEIQLFDVVKSILSIPIVDEDIFKELSSLREQNTIEQGTATSGTSSTLVDTANRKEANDFWKGGVVEIIDGTGKGQTRKITAFVQSSSTISVTPNFVTNPDTTSIYKVIRSFTEKIEQAFDELNTDIYNMGNRSALILESSQIKHPLLFLTIQKICLDLSVEIEDKWDRLATEFGTKYNDKFKNMKVEYDEDESGSIIGTEEQRKINEVRLYRA